MSGRAKFTKEDEALLQDFSGTVSKSTTVLFYGVALLTSLAPIYLYYGVHRMEIQDSYFIWAAAVIGATYILSNAYKNVKHVLKHQIILKRGDAVYREVTRQLADDKVMSKKEKEDRVLWKKNEVADYEASMFSIFYQNTFFFALFLIFSFFLFSSMNPIFNCLASIYGAAGIVYLFSTSK